MIRVRLPALLVAVATLAVALPAQGQLAGRRGGYRLVGDLRMDTYGYTVATADGRSYTTLYQQEGADVVLSGHLVGPAFVQGDLRVKAYAVHQLRTGELRNGSRLGLATRLTLLPWSIYPLTITAGTDFADLGAAGIPGQSYRTDVLGVDWRLTPRNAPRLFVGVRQVGYTSELDPDLPTETLSGLTSFEGLTRTAHAAVVHSDDRTNLRGRYNLLSRDSLYRRLGVGTETEQRLFLQTFDLDGTARLSEHTRLSLFGGGRLHEFSHADLDSSFQSFFARSYLYFRPSERLYGNVSYDFAGDSLVDTLTHTLNSLVDYELTDQLGLRGGAVAQVSTFTTGEFDLFATESIQAGAWWRTRPGRFFARIEDLVGFGLSQVDPGTDGILLGNTATAQGTWNLSRRHALFGSAVARHRTDTSSFGLYESLYGVDSRFSTRWHRFNTDLRLAWYRADFEDARTWIGADRRNEVRAEVRGGGILRDGLTVSTSVGYQYLTSEFVPDPSHGLYVSGGARYLPNRAVNLSAEATYFFYSYGLLGQNRLRILGNASILFRKLQIGAALEFNVEDYVGVSQTRWVLWSTVARRFDLGR